jgi:antitoxin (DNA-binding transcriptional repressor) of toxin-antitoxin stability system
MRKPISPTCCKAVQHGKTITISRYNKLIAELAPRQQARNAFVNLIWPLLILSFGPTWTLRRLPVQTPLFDPLPLIANGPHLAELCPVHFLEGPGRSEALRGRRPSV